MSWHFSQALVAAYSGDTCSAGAPSVQSSGNPIPALYCAPDRMKVFSRLSRFGMTFAPLTADLGEDVLTWCLAASPVRTSAQPAKAPESTESAAECGRTWPESLARYDPVTRSWRTPQCSLLADLDVFSETWPQWGTMHAGECWERTKPGHLTSGIASGLWPIGLDRMKETHHVPTPTASDHIERRCTMETKAAKLNPETNKSVSLDRYVKMWPTPCATDHKGSGKAGTLRDRLDYATERGATKSNTYATPQARDFRSGSTDRWDNPDRSRNLNDQIGGQLNPTWVEWLMGWPLGWTALKPLGTDKFPQWLHSHGGF